MKKKLNEKRAIKEYNSGIDSLVRMFLIKQGFEEDGEPFGYDFIGQGIDVIDVSGYVFNISDIYYDMEQRIDKGTILEWYDYNVVMITLGYRFVNYKSYLMGFRYNRNKFKEYMYRIKTCIGCNWYRFKYIALNKFKCKK